MVAKINRGASLYGAVIYNQQKVNESTARIISGNRMIADVTGNPEQVMRNTLWAFENYLLANRKSCAPSPSIPPTWKPSTHSASWWRE